LFRSLYFFLAAAAVPTGVYGDVCNCRTAENQSGRGFCSFHLPDTKKVHSAKAQQNARKSFIQFVQNHKNPNEF